MDARYSAMFRARQLQAIIDITPWTVGTNIINACVSLYFVMDLWPRWLALLWICAIAIFGSLGLPMWRSTRGQPLVAVSQRTVNKVVAHGVVLAALWAVIPAHVFLYSSPPAQLFIVGMTTGMICAGGFALSTMPRAANAYVCVLAMGAVIGAFRMPFAVCISMLTVLVLYVGFICAATGSLARSFHARLIAEANAAHQQEWVSLLLDDFQEHTSDWLWEIDADGRLCNVSPRFASIMDMHALKLEGRRLVPLLLDRSGGSPDDAVNIDGIGRLQIALLEARPFRNLQVSVYLGGSWRRWSLSGKPLFDNYQRPVGWRGVGSDITVTHEAHLEVRRLAITDEVTGLANRHAFKQALQRLGNEPAALFYLDLDNFKVINDVHGHAAGDGALVAVANHLRNCIQPTDLLARVGGDEFAVLRFGAFERLDLSRDAKRMCDALNQPCFVGSLRLVLGTSIGIAVAPIDAESGEALLRCADLAVYEAKNSGRGTWRFYTPELGERAAHRHRLQDDLRDGLHLEQFSVHFQPQFDAFGGRLIGAEALLRWRHPTRGSVSPVDFISAAEESGVIGTLGQWVLRRACEAAMQWPANLHVAVNVSAQQIVQPNWVRQVCEVLESTGLPPHRLELELTETALIENTAVAMSAIIRLRALGVRVALDDFGTGYSSLAYLRRFPFDKIKIDQSFVVGITRDSGALAIVTAVARLASALRLEVTAEGVENAEQTRLLRELGCTSLQGFLFAHPMTEEDMRQYVATDYTVSALPGVPWRRINSVTGEMVG